MTTTASPPPNAPLPFSQMAAYRAGVLGMINVAVAVLAVRLIVLVAILGGILLTWIALASPDPMRLGALGIYCGVIVLPTIVLASRWR